MSITNHYEGDRFIRTEYDFETSGASHEEVMQNAYNKAKALFGDVPFTLRSVDIRPAIEDAMANAVIFFASVRAEVSDTDTERS